MTSNDDFDWCGDPAVILHEQPPIAIYTNESGAIVLRMGGDVIGNEDQVVIVRSENALAIVGAILRAADMGHVELSRKLFDMPYGAGYEDVELPPAREYRALASDAGASASVTQAEAEKPKAAPLSNAERQRRFKEKRRAEAAAGNDGNDGNGSAVTEGDGMRPDELPLVRP